MEHLDHPSPPPHFNDAKMARFALRVSSSLLRGGGGLIVHFILSKIVGQRQPEVYSQVSILICINVTPLDSLHLSRGGDEVYFGGLRKVSHFSKFFPYRAYIGFLCERFLWRKESEKQVSLGKFPRSVFHLNLHFYRVN